MNEVSERIKQAIDNSGLSYRELEEITGIARSNINRYASGITMKIPIDFIGKIAEATNVSARHLLGWETQNEKIVQIDNAIKSNPTISQTKRTLDSLVSKSEDRERIMNVIEKYQALDDYKKRIIDTILDIDEEEDKPVLMAAHNDKELDETAEMLTDAERIDKLD